MALNVLITGGTGSFGQELVAQLLAYPEDEDDRIVVYSRDERKQEDMAQKFKHSPRLRFFLGDVRDKDRLKLAVRGVDTIVHAAALKIVPSLEYNPMEAVKTNVLGTQNLLEAIHESNYSYPTRLIALSTDKAVSPVNLYGATKLCLEKLVVAYNNLDPQYHRTSVVRYGNVAFSRGSVIPKFIYQRDSGQPITLTDERMTRFWIELSNAVRFVLDRLDDMEGGEVFIPEMPSFRVLDLAELLKGDKGYEVTGIRQGEKLHESIISQDEYAKAYHDPARALFVISDRSPPTGCKRLGWAIDSSTRTMPIEKLRAVFRGEYDRHFAW